MLKHIRSARAVLLVAAVFATSCAEYEFAEQDISVRYRAASDQITLELDTRGIYATGARFGTTAADADAKVKARIERMAKGERFIYLLSFPFIFDLDAEPKNEAKQKDDWIDPADWTRLKAVFDANVHVDSASAYLDSASEASATQSFRLENAAECISAMNEVITLSVRHELAMASSDDLDRDEVFASERSRTNLRSFADAGGQWLTLTEEALEVRIPLTPADLAATVRGIPSDKAPSPRVKALGQAFLQGLDELTIQDDVAVFRFPVGRDGALHWTLRAPRGEGAESLVAAFGDNQLKPQD